MVIVTDPDFRRRLRADSVAGALASDGAAPFEFATFNPPASLSKVWILTRSMTSEPAPGRVLGLVWTASTGWELLVDPRD
jgi:hypothetical protein